VNSEPDLLSYVQWLEAENERLRIERNGWRVLAEDSDEVERLRAALEQIAMGFENSDHVNHCIRHRHIARQALEGS
jgi:hypothetical protein